MKTLVITDKQLRLEQREIRPPREGECLVRVRAVGICATDLHLLDGRLKFDKMPAIPGHEVAGVVEKVGPGVDHAWLGRKVVVDPVIGCGTCIYCHAGRKLLCRQGGELGTTGGDGGYAEYVTVPAINLYSLLEPLAFEEGAVIEPLNCTLGAFLKAQPKPGESVVIFGSGPAGLLFTALARASGCAPVLIIGRGRTRLDLARRLGAAETWSYHDPGLADKIMRATGGEGPDIAVEASGADVAVRQAFTGVRRGGRVVLYGISGANRENISSDAIVAKDLSVVAGIGAPLLWDAAIRMAAQGQVQLRSLITHQFPLEEFALAIALARDGDRAAKVVLCP